MAVMVLLAAVMLLAWVGVPLGIARVEMREHSGAFDARLIGTASIVVTEIALFRLTQMLGAIGSGDLFSTRVTRHFRGFAFWLFVVAAGGVALPMIGALIRGTPHGFAVVLDLTKLLAVGVTLLLFLLARLLERARQLDEDMREIV